jgi:hypothetical protein
MSSTNNNELILQLATIADLRKQKLYKNAHKLALHVYDTNYNDLKPLQLNFLYDELIYNGRMMTYNFEEEFLGILDNSNNLEQTRQACIMNSNSANYCTENLQQRIKEINKMKEFDNVRNYRKNGRNDIAYTIAKYIHSKYINILSPFDKIILYNELIINGVCFNKKECYTYAMEAYNFLSKQRDDSILNILRKNCIFIETLKLCDEDKNLFNRFKSLVQEDVSTNIKIQNLNEHIKIKKSINIKYVCGGHYFEEFFTNLLKNIYNDCDITSNPNKQYQIVVCSMFGILDNSPDYEKSIMIHFNGEPYETLNKNKYDILFDTKKNNTSVYIPFYITSFYERRQHKPKNLLEIEPNPTKTKFCAFMYSACHAHRENFFLKLSEYKKVDALGRCMKNRVNNVCQNAEHTRNVNTKECTFFDSAVNMYKPYKFVIAFENNNIEGYITEKIINPVLANTIPIYWGSSDVKKHFNTKRFICVNDFQTIDECIKYIIKIDQDDQLYQQIISQPFFVQNEFNEYCLESKNNSYIKQLSFLLNV